MVCYNCLSKDNQYYAEENGFTLVKCERCGLVYLEDPPSLGEINDAHVQGLHKGENCLETTGKYNKSAVKRYVAILGELFSDGLQDDICWLDIGCGYGEFMEALHIFGPPSISVVGSEPNVRKQLSAQARGLNVDFINLDMHKGKYDFISLLNVYSHLPDPPSFLAKIRGLLKPNGEIIIETGDSAGFPAPLHYRPFYLPDHISFASESILTEILKKLNFNIITIKKYPHQDYHMSAYVLFKELVKLVLPGYKSRIFTFISDARRYSRVDMYVRAKIN